MYFTRMVRAVHSFRPARVMDMTNREDESVVPGFARTARSGREIRPLSRFSDQRQPAGNAEATKPNSILWHILNHDVSSPQTKLLHGIQSQSWILMIERFVLVGLCSVLCDGPPSYD